MPTVLGFGFDFREIITVVALIFVFINIADASGQFPNSISDQIIVGVLNSLFKFEETIEFDWMTTLLSNVPFLNIAVGEFSAGFVFDSLINGIFNLNIFGLKIFRILGIGFVWLTAINVLAPVISGIHGYEQTMMGIPR